MGFFDIFFGTPQSLYASYAILAAVITICITILLTGTDLTLGNRFLFIFLVILMLIPSVFLTLFQITCMVTGGNKNTRWWCWLYAWIMAVFIIIYCIFVIIVSFTSLFTYTNAMNKVDNFENEYKMNAETSNDYAKSMIENFENADPMKSVPEGTPAHMIPPEPGSSGRKDAKKQDAFTDYSSLEGFEAVNSGATTVSYDIPKPGEKAKPKVNVPEPEDLTKIVPATVTTGEPFGVEGFVADDKYASF